MENWGEQELSISSREASRGGTSKEGKRFFAREKEIIEIYFGSSFGSKIDPVDPAVCIGD